MKFPRISKVFKLLVRDQTLFHFNGRNKLISNIAHIGDCEEYKQGRFIDLEMQIIYIFKKEMGNGIGEILKSPFVAQFT